MYGKLLILTSSKFRKERDGFSVTDFFVHNYLFKYLILFPLHFSYF